MGESFIMDGTSIGKPYSISAVGGNVYVAESDYKNNGDIYCFGGDGKLFKKFEAGLNPMKVVLAQKIISNAITDSLRVRFLDGGMYAIRKANFFQGSSFL